jgi:hypothetical protein
MSAATERGPGSRHRPVEQVLDALSLVAFAEMDYFRADCRAPTRALA